MKKHLRKGDKSTLNIYLANLGGGILGYSTFPQDYKKNPQDDGVVILYSSIPNGSRAPYNLGKTAVHEVGHWMGLYHVFEGGCAYPGDFVEDTTPQKESTSGCPSAPKKSCSANDFNNPDDQVTFAIDDSDPSRTDMIHNVMDYSDDVCFNSKAAIFTKGQTKRMHGNWLVLRGKLWSWSDRASLYLKTVAYAMQ